MEMKLPQVCQAKTISGREFPCSYKWQTTVQLGSGERTGTHTRVRNEHGYGGLPTDYQDAIPWFPGLHQRRYEHIWVGSCVPLGSGWLYGCCVRGRLKGSGRLRAGKEFGLFTAVQAVACENLTDKSMVEALSTRLKHCQLSLFPSDKAGQLILSSNAANK